jgi:hypothetical protein
MELSRTIALVAVVLGLLLAAGHATAQQKKADEPEVQKRAALEAHEKRKAHFERSCNKALSSDTDFVLCRAAYRAFVATQK